MAHDSGNRGGNDRNAQARTEIEVREGDVFVRMARRIPKIIHDILYAACALIILATAGFIVLLLGMAIWGLLTGPDEPQEQAASGPTRIEQTVPAAVVPPLLDGHGTASSGTIPASGALPASGSTPAAESVPVTESAPAAEPTPAGGMASAAGLPPAAGLPSADLPAPLASAAPPGPVKAAGSVTTPPPATPAASPAVSGQATALLSAAAATVSVVAASGAPSDAAIPGPVGQKEADALPGQTARRTAADAPAARDPAAEESARAERWGEEQQARQRQQARKLELQRERERVRREARDEAARRQLALEIGRQRMKAWQHSSPLDVLEEHVDENDNTVLYESGIGWRGKTEAHIWLDVTVHPEPEFAGEEFPWLGLSIVLPEAGDFLFDSVVLVADGVAHKPAELQVDDDDRPDLRRATVQILDVADIRFLRRFVRADKPVLRYGGPKGQRNIRPSAQEMQDLRRVLEAWAFLYHAVLADEASAEDDEEDEPERYRDRRGLDRMNTTSGHFHDPGSSPSVTRVEVKKESSSLVKTAAALYILNTLADSDRQTYTAGARRRAGHGTGSAHRTGAATADAKGRSERSQVEGRDGDTASRKTLAGSQLSPLGRAAARARARREASLPVSGRRSSVGSASASASRGKLSGHSARSSAWGKNSRSSLSRGSSFGGSSKRRR